MIIAPILTIEKLLVNPVNLFNKCSNPVFENIRCIDLDEDYLRAAHYLIDNSEKNDYIYVAPGRHDKIFINAIALYFIVNRMSPTKWHDSHPGVQTSSLIQNEIISDFILNKPKFIVMDSRWDDVFEPNQSRYSSGSFELDEYIKENYKKVAVYNSISILIVNQ